MIRSLFVILIGAFLITGCSNTNSDRSALPSAVESGVGSVDAYWDEVAKQGLTMSPFVDPEPPMEYVRIGLNHDNPDVRWFCAYELLKYPSGIDQETRDTIERMTKDESEVVRKAASFTMAVLQERSSIWSPVKSHYPRLSALFLRTRGAGTMSILRK